MVVAANECQYTVVTARQNGLPRLVMELRVRSTEVQNSAALRANCASMNVTAASRTYKVCVPTRHLLSSSRLVKTSQKFHFF